MGEKSSLFHIIHIIILLAGLHFLPFVPEPASASDGYLFTQLSTSEGVPVFIQCLHTEKGGFVWAGTRKGLVRFNGDEVKSYKYQDDSTSLPGNDIYQLLEDSLHNFWVLTDGGLALYDRRSDGFHRISDGADNPIYATAACRSEEGVFFATRDCLYFYGYDDRSFRWIVDYPRSNSIIKEIHYLSPDVFLYLKQWGGLYVLDVRTGAMHPAGIESAGEVSSILPDSKGRLWITSYNRGVACLDSNGHPVRYYTVDNSGLSHNVILCMYECGGKIWIGTDGGGINILDPETDSITVLKHRSGDRNSLPDNSVRCLSFDDAGDNIWVGCVKGGLVYMRRSFICSYSDVPLNSPYGLSEGAVTAFCQEPGDEYIWISTDGGGINRFNPDTNSFRHYPDTWGEKAVSVCPYTSRELLVSLFPKGVFAFDKQSGTLRYMYDIGKVVDMEAMYSRKVVNLYRESPSAILLLSSSLLRYDISTGQTVRLLPDTFSVEGVLEAMYSDDEYTYFYDMRRIYRLRLGDDSLQVIYTAPPSLSIQCAAPDGEGHFWLGTAAGMNIYDPVTGTDIPWERERVSDVASLLLDRESRLWIGTGKGLFVWLASRRKLLLLSEADGVQPNEYHNRAVLATDRGDVFLGGKGGMVCVDAHATFMEATDMPELELMDILSDSHSMLGRMNEANDEIKLASADRAVTVRIIARESNRFRKHTFYWQIEGNGGRQVMESDIPEITLPLLTSGTYRVSASCSMPDNNRTFMKHIVTIGVPPPWYKTMWFVMLCAFSMAVGLIYAVVRTIRRKEEKMELALTEHKKQVYEEKVRFLININHELRTPLTLIHAPLVQALNKLSPDNAVYPLLSRVLKQSKRMKNMLDIVLSMRKMEMKETRLHMQQHILNDWLKDTADDFRWEGQERGVELVYDLDSGIGEVDFDNEKHTIILTNLLVNALKHSPAGGIITLRTEKVQNGNAVRISVMDQGKGLKGVDTTHLFERFYQGEGAKDGAGIGLSYAKILVEEHQGRIGACDNAKGGACFWYELPVEQKRETVVCQPQEYLNTLLQPQAAQIKAETDVTAGIDLRNYICLFVDDSRDLCDMMSEAFKGRFKKLLIASDGREALEIARREMPDVIISDIMMPGMDGYELCSHVKEDETMAYIQVVLLTARNDDGSRVDGYRSGADAYVGKPFEPESLMETVRNRLFLREQIKTRYAGMPPVDKPVNSADDAFMYKLNKLIMDNLSRENLDVSFLCEQMCTSRATLFNRVKALTGMGAGNYICKLRVEKAAEMLRHTSLSMTEIAEHTGFSSSRYFSTAFKKYMGVTPTQYKNDSSDGQLESSI